MKHLDDEMTKRECGKRMDAVAWRESKDNGLMGHF